MKAAAVILQGVLSGVIAACLLTVAYWLDGTFRLSQLGRSFEETAVFLTDCEEMIRRKVDSSMNNALFRLDGETNLNKLIDIRQYVSGVNDEANRNDNLTFRISDLINFYPGTDALEAAILSVTGLRSGDPVVRKTQPYEELSEAVSSIEIIVPVSGMTLEATARASDTPFETLLTYYEDLIRVSRDLHERYRSYVDEHEIRGTEDSSAAPSNIRYYIENTTSKQSYTNLGVTSVATARDTISKDPDLTFLFDGVRTMDIMVANSDLSLNSEVISKFIDTVFLGSNERVVIAVDRNYPAGDELREDYLAYQQREPMVMGALVTGILAGILLVILLVFSILAAGRRDRDTLYPLRGFDLIPTEIAAGISIVAGLSWFYIDRLFLQARLPENYRIVRIVVCAVFFYELFLLSFLSFARRFKHKSLWANSVSMTIFRVGTQVLGAWEASTRMLIAYVLFILMNFLFLRYFGSVGFASVIVIDLAALLYLLRDRLGKLSVRAGLRELSKGKLDYRIDTSSLSGDSLEMAQAVNEMGDGLSEAVESLVNSERMKAELITNVSHDLKTPLTSIINYIDLLKREDLQNERAKEYLDVLDRKSLRLKSLISDLIDVSRISSGNVELNMVPLDLRSMVRMAVGEFEDRFEMTGLKVCLDAQGEYPVIADGSMLYRVLDNLLGNIAKYAKDNSVVRIAMSQEEGMAVCTFENESKEELCKSAEELQERFVRGDRSRSSEGSGLGLSIARSLTELMQGTFSVRTTPQTFCARIGFPLRKEDPEGGAGQQ